MCGLAFAAGAGLWLIILAFQTSLGWGLASLFIPLAMLVFALLHLDLAKRPLILMVVGIALYFGGAMLA